MTADTLNQKRLKFPLMVVKLIEKAHEMGFDVTFGDAYRDPRMHGEFGEKKGYGAPKSCHKLRLAIDLNLYKDGKYLEQRPITNLLASGGSPREGPGAAGSTTVTITACLTMGLSDIARRLF